MKTEEQQELRDKIKHYENKESDLKEREKIFEQMMKEEHGGFIKQKTEWEQMQHVRELELTKKENE